MCLVRPVWFFMYDECFCHQARNGYWLHFWEIHQLGYFLLSQSFWQMMSIYQIIGTLAEKNIHIIYSRMRKILNHVLQSDTDNKGRPFFFFENKSALMSCSITDTKLSIYPAQPTVENQGIHKVTCSLKLELFSVPNCNLIITLPTGKWLHAKYQKERENRDTIWAKNRREHTSCCFGSVWVRCKFVPSDLGRGYGQDRNIKGERNYHENW